MRGGLLFMAARLLLLLLSSSANAQQPQGQQQLRQQHRRYLQEEEALPQEPWHLMEDNLVPTTLDDSNLRSAVELWTGNFRDQAVARELYGGDIQDWDTSRVTDLSHLFACDEASKTTTSSSSLFDVNPPIGQWNTERVTSLSGMLRGCASFDRDLSQWNTGRVTDMSFMFHRATNFTGSGLASWDVSSVVHMNDAFSHATRFEGVGLEDWQTSSVVSFQNTFQYTTSFNRDLSDWSLNKVVSIQAMFQGASSMNQSLCWPSLAMSTVEVDELGDDSTGRDGTAFTTPILGPVTVLTKNFNCDSPARLDPCCVSSEAVIEQTCCSAGLEEETGCDTFCATPPTSAPTATSTATLEPTAEPTFQDAMDDGNGTVVFEPTDMDGDGTAVFEPSDMDGANAITNADVSFVDDVDITSSGESSDATTIDGSSSDDGDQNGNVGAMTVGFLGGFAGIIAMIVIVSHVLATRRRLVDGDLDMLTIKPSTSIETNASWETAATSPRQETP